MDNKDLTLANYRLDRAKDDLDSAIQGLNEQKLRLANNRAYYSIFHSMRAVLALEQKDFKKHSAIIAYFNQHYIKTSLFPTNLYKIISTAEEVREASDYNDFYIASFDKTKEQVESAKLILDLVEQYIKQQETKDV